MEAQVVMDQFVSITTGVNVIYHFSQLCINSMAFQKSSLFFVPAPLFENYKQHPRQMDVVETRRR